MRRCKYYTKETWYYKDYTTNKIEKASDVRCSLYYTTETAHDFLACLFGKSFKKCPQYTPVEIDPYWKDIIDETNRRLNNTK